MFSYTSASSGLYFANPPDSGRRIRIHSFSTFKAVSTTGNTEVYIYDWGSFSGGSTLPISCHHRRAIAPIAQVATSGTVGALENTLLVIPFAAVAGSGIIYDLHGFILIPGKIFRFAAGVTGQVSITWEEF